VLPTGTQAEFETAVAQDIDGGDILGEHRGMAQVVVEHDRTEPERWRRLGGTDQRG
jgi:hypothetical protein